VQSSRYSRTTSLIGNRHGNSYGSKTPDLPPPPGFASFPTPHTHQSDYGGLGSEGVTADQEKEEREEQRKEENSGEGITGPREEWG